MFPTFNVPMDFDILYFCCNAKQSLLEPYFERCLAFATHSNSLWLHLNPNCNNDIPTSHNYVMIVASIVIAFSLLKYLWSRRLAISIREEDYFI